MQASKRVRGADENTGAAAAAVQQGKTAALVEERPLARLSGARLENLIATVRA